MRLTKSYVSFLKTSRAEYTVGNDETKLALFGANTTSKEIEIPGYTQK